MHEIKISAEDLIKSLLNLEPEKNLCLLDSGGVSYLESHLLIAGINPVETAEIDYPDYLKTLDFLDDKISRKNLAAIFTISYDFGLKINRISSQTKKSVFSEPDVFASFFDTLIVHDYKNGKTFLIGNRKNFDEIEQTIFDSLKNDELELSNQNNYELKISANFSREEYLGKIEQIKELIRDGITYQTNLTQQFRIESSEKFSPENIFLYLRKNHPTAFSSFIRRKKDVVVSASPERFFKVLKDFEGDRKIFVSPIKGTRRRGRNAAEDNLLRNQLLTSEKDRAENIMIVDLLRNDIGRICKYGSVKPVKICDLEKLSTLFHLVSTVLGNLREDVKFSDILQAVFPCGSITGAPKISTMQIIEKIENSPRGLSMGAIGYLDFEKNIDLSVAIRTMVFRDNQTIFNVGGGITIDSNAQEEFDEMILKSSSLFSALKSELPAVTDS